MYYSQKELYDEWKEWKSLEKSTENEIQEWSGILHVLATSEKEKEKCLQRIDWLTRWLDTIRKNLEEHEYLLQRRAIQSRSE